jgi:hypothetical protein
VTIGAADLYMNWCPTIGVAQLDRGSAAWQHVLGSPLEQAEYYRHEVAALVGETVLEAGPLAGLLVRPPLEQTHFDQLTQARRGDRLSDADAIGEVVEARGAVIGLAHDQHGRPRADHMHGLVDRTTLGTPGRSIREFAGQDCSVIRHVRDPSLCQP